MRVCLILLALLWATAAAAQESARFVLYFGLGSAAPSPEAREIIERAAIAARQRQRDGSFDHVKVIGYADTSGSTSRSQSLSEERARAVKTILVGHGLSAASITTEGRGKTSLAVETGDNVAEPRNRRARIVIYGPGE
jgi:outer membrane protein OmpA-like peptidoglycan-associated protein